MTDAPQEASRSNLAQRLIAALGQCDRVLVERKNAVGEYDVEIFQADSARDAADLVPDWSSDMGAAPKDGTRVLTFHPANPNAIIDRARSDNIVWNEWRGKSWYRSLPEQPPTLWMRVAHPSPAPSDVD